MEMKDVDRFENRWANFYQIKDDDIYYRFGSDYIEGNRRCFCSLLFVIPFKDVDTMLLRPRVQIKRIKKWYYESEFKKT